MYAWFAEKLARSQAVLKAQNVKLEYQFNSPAQSEEIERCERELGFILPESYKEFLIFSNGANLFCSSTPRFETAENTALWFAHTGIVVQSTNSIVEFNREQDIVYVDEENDKKYIAFAYLGYIGTGDFCSFDVTMYTDSEYKVLDCYHDVQFEDWHSEHIIADSFEDWLVKMFDEVIAKNYRPEYWIPSPLTT